MSTHRWHSNFITCVCGGWVGAGGGTHQWDVRSCDLRSDWEEVSLYSRVYVPEGKNSPWVQTVPCDQRRKLTMSRSWASRQEEQTHCEENLGHVTRRKNSPWGEVGQCDQREHVCQLVSELHKLRKHTEHEGGHSLVFPLDPQNVHLAWRRHQTQHVRCAKCTPGVTKTPNTECEMHRQ